MSSSIMHCVFRPCERKKITLIFPLWKKFTSNFSHVALMSYHTSVEYDRNCKKVLLKNYSIAEKQKLWVSLAVLSNSFDFRKVSKSSRERGRHVSHVRRHSQYWHLQGRARKLSSWSRSERAFCPNFWDESARRMRESLRIIPRTSHANLLFAR